MAEVWAQVRKCFEKVKGSVFFLWFCNSKWQAMQMKTKLSLLLLLGTHTDLSGRARCWIYMKK